MFVETNVLKEDLRCSAFVSDQFSTKGLLLLLLLKTCSKKSGRLLAEQSVYILLREMIWTEWWFILVSNTNSSLSLFSTYCSYSYIIKNRKDGIRIFFQVSFLTSFLFSICFFQENMVLTISSLVQNFWSSCSFFIPNLIFFLKKNKTF